MSESRYRRALDDRIHRLVTAVQTSFARQTGRPPGEFFDYPPVQSPAEEWVNGWTHALAAFASAAGTLWLVTKAYQTGEHLMTFGCALYGGSLTAVFAMSALSHFAERPRIKHLFRTLDQASIYLLTAGSFTPYFLRFLVPHGWDWMLPTLWCAALVLAWDKVRGSRVNSISVPSHVALGAFPFLAIKPVFSAMPTGCIWLVSVATACYLLGVVFLVFDHHTKYFHAIWHVLVIAASVCTFVGIPLYLL